MTEKMLYNTKFRKVGTKISLILLVSFIVNNIVSIVI